MRLSRSQCETVAILVTPFCMAESFQSYAGHNTHPASTLVTLAQTCRAVSEVALQEIWRELPYCGVLVHALPRDLWEADWACDDDDDDDDDKDADEDEDEDEGDDADADDDTDEDEDEDYDDDEESKQYYVSTTS